MRIDEKKTAERKHMVFYQGNMPEWYKEFEKKYDVKITVYSPSLYDGCYIFEVKKDKTVLFEIDFFPLLINFTDDSTGDLFEVAMQEYIKEQYKEGSSHKLEERQPYDKEIAKITLKGALPDRYCLGIYIFLKEKNCWVSIDSHPIAFEKEDIGEWITFERKEKKS